ncbi:hypothetical protein [Sinorhizobium meliloti]|uniref:hypothetical protein n=1 Tax=Rhizobium meliloti TaxID=382 RepID=UPI003F5CD41D
MLHGASKRPYRLRYRLADIGCGLSVHRGRARSAASTAHGAAHHTAGSYTSRGGFLDALGNALRRVHSLDCEVFRHRLRDALRQLFKHALGEGTATCAAQDALSDIAADALCEDLRQGPIAETTECSSRHAGNDECLRGCILGYCLDGIGLAHAAFDHVAHGFGLKQLLARDLGKAIANAARGFGTAEHALGHCAGDRCSFCRRCSSRCRFGATCKHAQIGRAGKHAARQHGDDSARGRFADAAEIAARIGPSRAESSVSLVPPLLGICLLLSRRDAGVRLRGVFLESLLGRLPRHPRVDRVQCLDDGRADAGDHADGFTRGETEPGIARGKDAAEIAD